MAVDEHVYQDEAEHQEAFEPPKSGCSTALKWFGCGCGVFILLIIIAGIIAYVSAASWMPVLARSFAVAMVEQIELPEEQEKGVIEQIDRVFEALDNGEISTDDLPAILEELAESPLLPLAMIDGANSKYVQPSGLSDEEKKQGAIDLQRFGRGVIEETIDRNSIDAVADYIIIETEADGIEFREHLSDTEVRDFIADAKAFADAAEVPQEAYEVDYVEELRKTIDKALGQETETEGETVPQENEESGSTVPSPPLGN